MFYSPCKGGKGGKGKMKGKTPLKVPDPPVKKQYDEYRCFVHQRVNRASLNKDSLKQDDNDWYIFWSSIENSLDWFTFKNPSLFKSYQEFGIEKIQQVMIAATHVLKKRKFVDSIDHGMGDTLCCSDCHGQPKLVLQAFAALEALDKNSCLVFLGDYIDRGCGSLLNLVIICYGLLIFGDRVKLVRGNHEDRLWVHRKPGKKFNPFFHGSEEEFKSWNLEEEVGIGIRRGI